MPRDFEQLVRQHSARIRRIARRYAASGAVDDLVQDILVRLWRRSWKSKSRSWPRGVSAVYTIVQLSCVPG
jgi:DNA-directed RNA polymerase specialized sigma24 family protein